MIEKYFQKGIRLDWIGPYDAPNAPMDGTIVNNPPPPNRPMLYDGLDPDLYVPGAVNITTLGFKKGMTIPYSWLSYGVGRTLKKMLSGGDVLTGYMSGCPITMFTENGSRYVGHVGTYDADPAINKSVRETFARFMPRDTTGFNPFGAWTPNEIGLLQSQFKQAFAGAKILALVTTTGAFYSILAFRLTTKAPIVTPPNNYCVGGIKLVPPMGYAALRKWIAPTLPMFGSSRV